MDSDQDRRQAGWLVQTTLQNGMDHKRVNNPKPLKTQQAHSGARLPDHLVVVHCYHHMQIPGQPRQENSGKRDMVCFVSSIHIDPPSLHSDSPAGRRLIQVHSDLPSLTRIHTGSKRFTRRFSDSLRLAHAHSASLSLTHSDSDSLRLTQLQLLLYW